MSTALDRIARDLLDLRRDVRRIQTQPQLAHSSIEGGYLLWNDDDGAPAVVVGQQFDGTNAASILTGPTPPMPTTPTAVSTYFAATVTWDGLFVDGALVPMDFARVEIHAVEDVDDPADTAETLVGTFETPRGGDQVVPLSGPRYIKLVSRSLSGAHSDASAATGLITPIPAIDTTAIEAALEELNDVTIPGIAGALVTVQDDLDELNTTTIPGINTTLTAAGVDITALEGRFPIQTVDIGAGQVTGTIIADNSVTTAKIVANTIIAADIAADTITGNEIAANAISTAELNALAVTAAKIAANTITAGQIAATTITGDRLVANTITAGQIAANTITAAQIAALTITASQITANTITAAKIAAGTITATEIAANTITAAKIAAGTITATEIAANTITTAKLSSTAIDGMTITGATIQSAASGSRFIGHIVGTQYALDFYTGTAGESPARIIQDTAASGGLQFSSGRVGGDVATTMELLPSWGLQVPDGIQVGGVGTLTKVLKWNVQSVTSNASGDVTITHGAGQTPATAWIQSQTGTFLAFRVVSLSSTTFTFRTWNLQTAAVHASATFSVGWMAVA